MAFQSNKKTATVAGVCSVEEAEPLMAWIVSHRGGRIDLSDCTHMHTSVLQVLMALRPTIWKYPASQGLSAVLRAADIEDQSREPI